MSDQARLDAIFAKIAELFPGRMVRELTAGNRATLAGARPCIEFLDHSTQSIGGPLDPFAVHVYVDGRRLYLSDADLPKPTLKPASQHVQNARAIAGLEPGSYLRSEGCNNHHEGV